MQDLKVSEIFQAANDLYINRILGLTEENERLKVYKKLYEELTNENIDVAKQNVELCKKVRELEEEIKCWKQHNTPF